MGCNQLTFKNMVLRVFLQLMKNNKGFPRRLEVTQVKGRTVTQHSHIMRRQERNWLWLGDRNPHFVEQKVGKQSIKLILKRGGK